jgi:hypothetical protein
MMVLTCVARLFPRLNSIALLCGSRIASETFAERMAALSITSIQLQASKDVCSSCQGSGQGRLLFNWIAVYCAPCSFCSWHRDRASQRWQLITVVPTGCKSWDGLQRQRQQQGVMPIAKALGALVWPAFWQHTFS